MIRSILAVLAVAMAGFAVTNVAFRLVLPLVLLAIKIVFFVAIAYLILRLVNPDLADKLKNRCCGTPS